MDECGIVGKGNVSGFHFCLLYNFKMGPMSRNEAKRSMTSKSSISPLELARSDLCSFKPVPFQDRLSKWSDIWQASGGHIALWNGVKTSHVSVTLWPWDDLELATYYSITTILWWSPTSQCKVFMLRPPLDTRGTWWCWWRKWVIGVMLATFDLAGIKTLSTAAILVAPPYWSSTAYFSDYFSF